MKAVIFDMDGVLVDSYMPHYESWKITCDKRGIELDLERFASLFGSTFLTFAKELGAKMTQEQLDEWYFEKEHLYRELIKDEFPASPGASALLKDLGDSGISAAIGSAGPRGNVDCILAKLENANVFGASISGDDVVNGKPDPEVFLKAAETLGAQPKNCAVVEDSIHGLRGARAGGMKAIGVTGTKMREELAPFSDIVVDSLEELDAQKISDLIDN